MTTEPLSPKDKLKLVIISTHEFNNDEVEKLFMEMQVESFQDIREIIYTMEKHRPELVKRIEEKLRAARNKNPRL